MTIVADKLREARALIEPDRAWAQGYSAYTAAGRRTTETDPEAASFCMIGALSKVHNARWSSGYYEATNALRRAAGTTDLVSWNDRPTRSKAEVLAAFDKAIELAEQSA